MDRETLEKAGVARFGDRPFEDGDRPRILVAEIDQAVGGADGAAGPQHPVEDRVRIMLQKHPILETAGLAFVRVTDDDFRRAGSFPDRAPLRGRGETRAPASRQAARAQPLQASFGFGPLAITAARSVIGEPGTSIAKVPEEELRLAGLGGEGSLEGFDPVALQPDGR
jgi:hypothetical protein